MMKPAKTPLHLALLAGLALPMTAHAQYSAPAPVNSANHFAAANQPQMPYIAPQLRAAPTYRLAPQRQMQPQMPRQVQAAPQAYRRVVMPAPQYRVAPAGGRYGPQNSVQAQKARSHKPSGFIDRLLNLGSDKHLYANYRDRLNNARLPQYQMAPRPVHPLDRFARWQESEPDYALYPGDQVDIVVGSAPELSRTLTVGPDGRVVMPMTQPIMAAGKSLKALEAAISAELAKQLVDPRIAVTPRAYGPQQIFVGGQVGAQGTYTLPGPVGVTEAVLMAGGFANSAQLHQVVVLRRAPTGGFMARTIDFRDGLHNPLSLADNVQLRRGDIVFVPRSDIAEIGLFMQQYVRDALPFGLNLSYNLGEGVNQ